MLIWADLRARSQSWRPFLFLSHFTCLDPKSQTSYSKIIPEDATTSTYSFPIFPLLSFSLFYSIYHRQRLMYLLCLVCSEQLRVKTESYLFCFLGSNIVPGTEKVLTFEEGIKFFWQKPKSSKWTFPLCDHISSKDAWFALSALNGQVSYSDLWEKRAHYYTAPWPNGVAICIFHLF